MGQFAEAAEPTAVDPAAAVEFFEQKIRPVLVSECYECHSAKAAAAGKLKGGLALDSREAIRRGGESGPAVVPGKIGESLIVAALKHETYAMPPTKRLSSAIVADFERWIRDGAVDPRDGAAPVAKHPAVDFEKARREHWSFQPLSHPAPPTVRNKAAVRNDVDRFLQARLEAAGGDRTHGLEPAGEAEPSLLLRRVYFDLIGLPPSVEEIEAFTRGEESYEAVVDRLLASPHYGERWGRHWLDLARYADSSGFHNDLDRPNAWRYRDYVIDAFNQDKPFARFTAEQLAGDEIDGASDESLIATGFNCNGPSNSDNVGKTELAREQYRLDQLDDVISTVSTVFLGLTIGCARCHDHKIDPIASEDYYRLLAVFNGTEVRGGPKDPAKKKETDDAKTKIQSRVEASAQVRPTYLLRRGNVEVRGPIVEPGVPQIAALRPVSFPKPVEDAKTSGRRLALAEWIASPDNPLSYRVLANRLWQHHFGTGIVATPSNFGLGGALPTHPELLDYLAHKIIADGGRLKPTHRLIVTSAAYRRASGRSAEAATLDPENRLLSHFPVHRLEAEVLRDAVLSLSGKLNPERGGPGIKPRIRRELLDASKRNTWPTLDREGPKEWRRSVYIYVKRQLLMPMMELFDAPTTTTSVADRGRSVVPTQALLLMNDEFIEEQAGYFAERMQRESDGKSAGAVARMLLAATAKMPAAEREQEAIEFVRERWEAYHAEGADWPEAKRRALADLAHVLFNCNEFVFVE